MEKILQDLHTRNEEPFASVSENILRDVLTSLDSGDTLIQTGDWFHTSKPFPEEYRKTLDILQRAIKRGVKIVVLTGNHDFHYDRNSYSTAPLEVFGKDIDIISEPTLRVIGGSNYLFLPWMPHTLLKKNYGVKTLKEYYEEVFAKELNYKSVDFVVYHFEDETVFLGGMNDGVDLSFLEKKYPNIKRLGGHIHLQSKNYIGTPFQTRYDERGQKGRIGVVKDGEFSYESLNNYLEFLDIDFVDNLPQTSGISYILTIKNAPSMRSAYERFKKEGVYIRKVELSTGEEREVNEENLEEASLKELMKSFVEKNKVDKETSSYLLELL